MMPVIAIVVFVGGLVIAAAGNGEPAERTLWDA